MAGINVAQLSKITRRLAEVAVDPSLWPDVLDQISIAVGATGAALLQSDNRTPDVPRSPGVDELFRLYFQDNWHVRDIRAIRGVPLFMRDKVIFDQDFLTPEDMRRDALYSDILQSKGMRWFAGVGFRADRSLWALSIQRSAKEGPFAEADKRVFRKLSDHLTVTASLAKAIEARNLHGITNALDFVQQSAMALDATGSVISTNHKAEAAFDDWLRVTHGRLRIKDDQSRSAMEAVLRASSISGTCSPQLSTIVVRRGARRPIIACALPIGGPANYLFLGAKTLLLLTDLETQARPKHSDLAQIFGLTPAESRLAAEIAAGTSLDDAADILGIARETARNHLKSVFAKTDTHRQGELISLLSRVARV